MKYLCGCLNVKLHIRSPSFNSVDKEELGVSDPSYENDDFFSGSISKSVLDIEGVQELYSCLVAHRTVGSWIVAQCLNCQVSTHAIHINHGGNEILVNASLKSGPTYIEQLMKSENYSPLYKIVINRSDHRGVTPNTKKFEQVDSGLTELQGLMNSFLMTEEANMENRVQQFMDSEQAKFSDLQTRVRREKNVLFRLILASAGSDTEPIHNNGSDSSVDDSSSSDHLLSHSREHPKLNQHDANSNSKKAWKGGNTVSSVNQFSSSPENEHMFILESCEDNSPMAINDSDSEVEESSDGGDSSLSSSSSHDYMHTTTRSSFSSSCPVDVPKWTVAQDRNQQDDDSNDESDERPDDIAASIKALAMSVREDGTEIFGDLPRKKISRVKFTAEKVH